MIQTLIVGSGYIGSLLALCLSQAGQPVTIIEKLHPQRKKSPGKYFGLARESRLILQQLGLWTKLEPHCTAIQRMDIAMAHSHDQPWLSLGGSGHVVGRMIPADLLQETIQAALEESDIDIHYDTTITAIEQTPFYSQVITDNGTIFQARLIVGADGMHSTIRRLSNIDIKEKDYHQIAYQWQITHSNPHDQAGYELLLPDGPFVVLPLSDACASRLIWCTKPQDTPNLDHLNQTIVHYFPTILGDIHLIEPQPHYPLSLSQATAGFQGRVVLIGDAYQRVHPVAAQGLNMGIRDADRLAKDIIEAEYLGLDIGDTHFLESYHQARRFDRFIVRSLTDFLATKAGNIPPLHPTAQRISGKIANTTLVRKMIKSVFHGE